MKMIKPCRIVSGERHMADAAIRRRDDQTPEQAVGEAVTDRQPGPAARIFTRGHAFNADKHVIQPPRPGQPTSKRRLK